MLAVDRQYESIVNVLLELNLSKPFDSNTVNMQNSNGYTALMLAVNRNYESIVNALLEGGADDNAQNSNGYTALMLAVDRQYESIVNAILSKHSNTVNTQNSNGYTALMLAVDGRSMTIVNMLLQFGADINIINRNGITAFEMAIRRAPEIAIAMLSKLPWRTALQILLRKRDESVINALLSSLTGDELTSALHLLNNTPQTSPPWIRRRRD